MPQPGLPKGCPPGCACVAKLLVLIWPRTRNAAVLALWQDLGAQSSVVHLERELDFTLVILTVAYRSNLSEVSRVEEIE